MSKQMKSTSMSRRTFMAGLGAASAAPFIIPSTALGADGSVAPSEKVNIGLIGCGGQGNGVMGAAMGQKNTVVTALCDVNENNLRNTKKKVDERYGNEDCRTFADFREVCALDDLDAIIIGTPDHWHALIAIEAANNKKDIYCEKPLTWSLGEGRAVVEAVKRNNVILQVGSMQRSSSQMKEACELVKNGAIGKINHVIVGLPDGGHAKWVMEYPEPPSYLDYDMYVGPAEWAPYHPERLDWNWRWWMGFGGSQMMDWIGHHGDIANMAMDWSETGPEEIVPEIWEFSKEKNNLYNSPERYRTSYTYKGGVTMTMGSTNTLDEVFTKNGDNGTQWFGEDGKWIFVSRSGMNLSDKDIRKDRGGKNRFRFRKEGNHVKDWLNSIQSREAPIAPVEAGHRAASIGHLAKIAHTVGTTLQWDPVKESFVGNEALDGLLTRKYRGEWKLG